MNHKNSEIAHTSSTPNVNGLLSRSSAADSNQGASGYYPLSIDENPLYSVSPSAKQIVLTGDPRYAFTDAWQGFIKVTSSGLYRIQITEITDASGIRTITYNEYNEASSENLNGDEINHLISETQDSYGRNTGYSYSKAGSLQQSVNIGYGEEGRIATTSFLHEGIEQQFSYSYLEGSNLLQTLAHPNNILLSNTYEEQRNLITSMNITRGTTDVVLRSYSYDALARPLSRDCGRRATSRNDNFTYNTRSELIQAELGSKHYAYSYDNIGNRKTVQELAEESTYEANQLNQYREITQGETPFTPTFDADGNQTLIKTSTGIWTVAYNADKRPTSFSQSQGDQSTIIECGYDYMGRRYTKKVTSNGTVSLHQRYIYRGYLQIACVDLSRSEHPALWYITWDPTEPIATRPLAIQKNATWYSYSHDLTKNVSELYQSDGLIATTYDYSPYGATTAEGLDQPIQYSSEYHDAELALTYYHYRHYNPTDGRWINRDPIGEDGDLNLYGFLNNSPLLWNDILGLSENSKDDCDCEELLKPENVKKCLIILVGEAEGRYEWANNWWRHPIPNFQVYITSIPHGGFMKLRKEAFNIQVYGSWATDEYCTKVGKCYDKSFLDMVTVVLKGVYLDANKEEYTDYIFNGHLMGLTRKEHAAGMGNHNPESYATGTLLAHLGYNRQIGVEITVSGADVTVGKKRVKYTKHRINFRK